MPIPKWWRKKKPSQKKILEAMLVQAPSEQARERVRKIFGVKTDDKS